MFDQRQGKIKTLEKNYYFMRVPTTVLFAFCLFPFLPILLDIVLCLYDGLDLPALLPGVYKDRVTQVRIHQFS